MVIFEDVRRNGCPCPSARYERPHPETVLDLQALALAGARTRPEASSEMEECRRSEWKHPVLATPVNTETPNGTYAYRYRVVLP